ncbi:hypothetical protein HYY75_06395 [bacterium]|nr:hypothetical protein [bacterium]
MVFLKRTLPLIITFSTGIIMILAFFSGPDVPKLKSLEDEVQKWTQIIFVFTMVLGEVSLLRLNLDKVSRKVDGWGYNLVLVIGFVSMTLLGFIAGFESRIEKGQSYWWIENALVNQKFVTVEGVEIDKDGNATVAVVDQNGEKSTTQTTKLKGSIMAWFSSCEQVVFDGVFKAAQATMFSLLAFFVASASFRAFRVKSKEAVLLMGSAFIVMIGNVPVGNFITELFSKIELGPFNLGFVDIPALKEWIMTYPSSAAQSAILIGAMLGYISASLKVMAGVERSYLGGEN